MSPRMVSGNGQHHTNEADPAKPDKVLTPYVGITWPEVTALVDNPQQVHKDEAQWLIPSTLASRKFLRQEAEGSYWLLWADLDKAPPPLQQVIDDLQNEIVGGADFEVFSSRSATVAVPKARILIPLGQPLRGGDWVLCQEVLNDQLEAQGIQPDRVSQRTGQLCYLPNRGKHYEAASQRNGSRFDPLTAWATEIAAKRQALADKAAAQEAARKAAAEARAARAAQPGGTGGGHLIEPFNAAYHVSEILLRAGYKQRGDTYCHPASESGSYSASVKDGRVHSLSSGDSLFTGGAGGGAHDAFSAFTVLMHGGDRDAALKDAGDNWLMIGGESWNAVKQREWIEQQQRQREQEHEAAKALARGLLGEGTEGQPLPGAGPKIGEGDDNAEQRREQQRKKAQDIGDGTDGQAPLIDIMGLDEMIKGVVFISDGSRVAYRDRPQTALPLNEFKLHTRASETRVGKKHIPTADLWVQDPQRITTHTLTYRPGHPEFTADPEGSPALNLWRDRPRVASSASVAPFLQHVAYLVPDEAERERFLSWLAHIEQHPGVLPHTHYLMVTPQTGIGRNWLASLLARVWAGATRLGFDLMGAMHSGFNGALSRRLLVIVDELKAADTHYGAGNHAEALKAMLTTEHRGINPKFGRQHIEFNCARWLMLSQHYDALPLARSDRRVIVISNPTTRKPADYYARLYAMLDDAEFVGAVAGWLAARDLAGFNPSEPAPLTEAKAKAIEANISDLERALIELRDGTDALVMTNLKINEYMQDCGIKVPFGRAMSVAYAATGLVPCDRLVTLLGKKHRVVALRDGERIKTADTATLMDLLGSKA